MAVPPGPELYEYDSEMDDFIEWYRVEEIEGHVVNADGSIAYYVSWTGYPDDEDSRWVDEDDMSCYDLLEEYWYDRAVSVYNRIVQLQCFSGLPVEIVWMIARLTRE